MKNRARFYALILFLGSIFTTNAQDGNLLRDTLYSLFVNTRSASWKYVLSQYEKEPRLSLNEGIELLTGYYGLIGYYMNNKQVNLASPILKNAQNLLSNWIDRYPNEGALYSIRGNLTGFVIAISPTRAPFLYSSMLSDVKKGLSMSPNNPICNIMYANILFYMPGIFGGDKEQSLKYFNQAYRLVNQNNLPLKKSWLYIQLMVSIALNNEKLDNYTTAQKMYQRVMAIAPNYTPVSQKFYPNLLQSMNE